MKPNVDVNWLLSDSFEHKYLNDVLSGSEFPRTWESKFWRDEIFRFAVKNGKLTETTIPEQKDETKRIRRFGVVKQSVTLVGSDYRAKDIDVRGLDNWKVIPIGISHVKALVGNRKKLQLGSVIEATNNRWVAQIHLHRGMWERKHLGDYYSRMLVEVLKTEGTYRIGEIIFEKPAGRTHGPRSIRIDQAVHKPVVELVLNTLIVVITNKRPPRVVNARLPKEPDNLGYYDGKPATNLFSDSLKGIRTCGYRDPDPFVENQDAPWLLRLNPFFAIFGWKFWWEYEYVSGRLTKSKTHWMRVDNPPE